MFWPLNRSARGDVHRPSVPSLCTAISLAVAFQPSLGAGALFQEPRRPGAGQLGGQRFRWRPQTILAFTGRSFATPTRSCDHQHPSSLLRWPSRSDHHHFNIRRLPSFDSSHNAAPIGTDLFGRYSAKGTLRGLAGSHRE